MSKELLVTNIQRMCMHDGPGLRTTVFLKGCNLHCPWCANPENIQYGQEEYVKDGRRGIYGRFYTEQELFEEIIRDQRFWRYRGGVTFSGGEPLQQAENILPVLERLRSEQIHIAVETALYVDMEQIKRIIPYVELFIVDIKILHPLVCRKVLGGNVELYYRNLELLQQSDKEMIFRIPCNWEYTMKPDNLRLIFEFLKKYPHIPVEIFATHSLGNHKYESLGLQCREWKKVPDDALIDLSEQIKKCGNNVTVNSL